MVGGHLAVCQLKLKGSSTFRPLDDKPSFTIEVAAGSTNEMGIQSRFHLNNCVLDPTFLREGLAAELYGRAGIPCASVRHARVIFNERDLGFYNLVETVDESFLDAQFKSVNGNLFEGKGRDINEELLRKNGINPGQKGGLEYLAAVAQIENPEQRWNELNRILDVERFIRLLAMDTLTGQVDGYATKRNNYSIYHDPLSNKWGMIPHGMDRAFRAQGPSVFPPEKYLLAKAVLQTAQGREAYLKTFSVLLTNVMQASKITEWIQEHSAMLVSASTNADEAKGIKTNADELSQYIVARLEATSQLLKQIQSGPARISGERPLELSGWRYRPITNDVASETITNGTPVLSIHCTGGVGRGSWRTKVYLEPGQYVFSGRVRTAKVAFHRGALDGASLYTSKQSIGLERVTGDSDWTEMRQAFEVTERPAEVELIAELRAIFGGDAWFDKGSLKLWRRVGAE